MKIHFANVYGNTVEQFITHSVPYAIVEDGEEELALSQGWYRLYWKHQKDNEQVWGQARQVRVRVDESCWNRTPRKIYKKNKNKLTHKECYVKDLSDEEIFSLKHVFYRYLYVKKYTAGADLETVESYQEHFDYYVGARMQNRRVFMYFYEGRLIAFSCFEEYPKSFFGSQFAWDYRNPELSLGLMQINILCSLAKKENKDYVYLGMSYGSICSYKSRFKGFEYWTGKEWSRDAARYQKELERDDGVKDLDDLELAQDSMYDDL